MHYNKYVSLGHNCEVAFQFRRLLGTDSSSFFSWNVTDFAALTAIISNDFAGILDEKNLEKHGDGSLVCDKSYNYLFHSPFTTKDPLEDPNFRAKFDVYRNKAHYLVEKFKEGYIASDINIAYFHVSVEESCKDKAIKLLDVMLQKHKHRNFTLIILQDEKFREQPWGYPNLANHYIKRLAPWYDATDGHVASYDRIFKSFPFAGDVHYAGF